MKKVLRAVFSMLMVASVAFSASADATLNASKQGSPIIDAKRQALSRAATARPADAKETIEFGNVRSNKALNPNAIRSAFNKSVRSFKKPIVHEAANVPEIYGCVIFANSWSQSNQPFGLYQVPTNAAQSFSMVIEDPDASFGGVMLDGVYYATTILDYGFMQIPFCEGYSLETKSRVYSSYNLGLEHLSKGLSEYHGTVYGIFYTEDGSSLRLGTIDYEADGPVMNEIAPLDGDWTAFAVDGNGQGYGLKRGTESTILCKINLADGVVTEVGATGHLGQYASGMAFETRSNRLFWAISEEGEGYMSEINTTTGEATVIYEFPNGEEVTGLYIPTPPADGAPSAATGLVVDFPEGKFDGTVKFNIPANLYGGAAGTGNADYTIAFNNQTVKTGSAAYGATVTESVSVPEAGDYKVTVMLSNAEGNSPITKTELYIGVGVPTTPEVKLVYENGNMLLSWTPVTSTIEGGYIDEKAVTYDVTRYPGEVVVGKNLNVNAISQEIDMPEELALYYYTVVAHNGEKTSAAGKSNIVTLGNGFNTPYDCTFDSADDFAFFTVYDLNEDGKTWIHYGDAARITYSNIEMNDWLITAPVKLEAGKLYEFEFDARGYSERYPELLEVFMGQGNAVEDMTTVVFEEIKLVSYSATWSHFKTRIIPETSGYYNFGFHGYSPKNMFYLFVDNIHVSGAMSADIPAAVTDLTVEPGTNGDLYATVSFVSPSKLLSGKDATSLTKIEVLMNGEVIATPRPLVNTRINVPAIVEEDGTYDFTVVAYNENGVGASASASAYIGIDYPEAVTNAKVIESASKLGEVTVTWDAVNKDVRGNQIDATYSLYDYTTSTPSLIADNLTEPKYTYQAVAEGEQGFVQYAVFANSKRGEGKGILTHAIVGTPYVNYFESFPDGTISHVLVNSTVSGTPEWSLFNDNSGIPSADGDNGFIGMKGNALDDTGALLLGKMSLADMTNPVFSFYTYNMNLQGSDDLNILEVYVDDLSDDADFQLVYENYVCETGAKDAWNKVVVDLSEYAGKTVELKLSANVQAAVFTLFDAFKVAEMINKDLSVKIDAPATVVPGKEIKVNVTVKNEADKASDAYVAKVKANNVVFATIDGKALEQGEAKTFQVPYTFAPVDENPVEFVAEVICDGDENKDNNVTDAFLVTPKLSVYPAPVALEGEVTPEGVKLNWGEPDLTGSSLTTFVEDFESGEAGDMEFEGWTFIDVDGSEVGGVQNVDVPGITVGETKASFFIFDSSLPQFNESYHPHSGSKFLASLFRYDDGQTDDWAISPELSGNAQTVSFFARSYSSSYPEKIEVYYSTGSLDPKDFVKVDGLGGTVPDEWTLYSAELPEGTKHFAIRSCASSSFMLLVDDVTYETGIDFKDLSIVGYNVYRNALKVNAEPEAECEYLDTEAVAQNNEYAVTALYTIGESKASEKILVTTTGIDNVLAGVEIVAEAGQIIVTGAEGLQVSVVAVDGKVVFAAAGEAKTVVTVTPGVYVVKAGAKVAKVLVK